MRITNAMMISNYINNLYKSTSKVYKMQNQISSGKRLSRASDDPVAASKAIEIRTNLSRVKQYSNNVIEAGEWLNQTESSLNELNTLLTRAYELTVSASNGANGENELAAIADEIDQINEQIVVCANTTFKSKYIFGGMSTTAKPFEVQVVAGEKVLFYQGQSIYDLADPANADELSKLKSEKIEYDIGYQTSLDVSYNGIDLLGVGEDNIYAILNNLSKALRSGDHATIEESVTLVSDKQGDIVSKLGEIGGKSNRLDFFKTRLGNDEFNYRLIQENTEGIAIEEVIMNLKMQEAVYMAALSAGARIIVPSLADFLR